MNNLVSGASRRRRSGLRLSGFGFRLIGFWLIGFWLVAFAMATASAAPFVGAPEHTSGEYVESTIDIQVKVMGGQVAVERTWRDGAWHLNRHWDALGIQRDALDGAITSIDRNGDVYEPAANDPDLFRFGKRRGIEVTAGGFRWSDRAGNWIDFDTTAACCAMATAMTCR